MDEKEKLIQKLKDYFEKRDDIVMAFLFGSQAKGYARRVSDWDIGIYLAEENWEKERGIWGDIERIVQAEVDLVVLNRAPASIAWNILRAGIPLSIKNRRIYLWLLLRSSHEANAWYRTADDYHRVFERSASLNIEDRQRLEKIIRFLEEALKEFDKFKKLTWQEYANDPDKKRSMERWAEQIMNAVIDSAEIILASERKIIPETYRQIVEALAMILPFKESDVCSRLAKWVEMRNILAHEYLDYRWKELSVFVQNTEQLVRSFVELVKNFIEINKF